MVKKIAVFGGTGMTGQSVVEYALNQGEPKYINSIEFIHFEKDFLLSFGGVPHHKNDEKKPQHVE